MLVAHCVCVTLKNHKSIAHLSTSSCREMEPINKGREKCCTCWRSNPTLTKSAQEQVAWVRVCNFRKIQNWSEFTTSTKNSNTYCGAARKYKSLLLSTWLGVLFFVHFSNLTGLQRSTGVACSYSATCSYVLRSGRVANECKLRTKHVIKNWTLLH